MSTSYSYHHGVGLEAERGDGVNILRYSGETREGQTPPSQRTARLGRVQEFRGHSQCHLDETELARER